MNLSSPQFQAIKESIELMPMEEAAAPIGALDKIVTSTSLILIDDDVLRVYMNPDIEFGNLEADENVKAVLGKFGSRKFYSLIVPDPSTHITVDARRYRNEAYDRQKLAEAIVIKELAHRILARAYLGAIGKPTCPTRIFNCETEAMDWLNGLKKSN